MPYLRLTCPPLSPQERQRAAERLTEEIGVLFFNPHGGPSREELRERTTVHFLSYEPDTLFIGGRTPEQRRTPDVTLELSDWWVGTRLQRRAAARLTPLLASIFGVPQTQLESVNVRFHPYPPQDFAVGGRLLSDLVPKAAQLLKKLLG